MFNQVTLAGRLGQDPEIRSTTGGKDVATIRLCTTTWSKGKEYTEWHTVVAWGDGLVGIIEKNLAKGDMILVTGQMRTRKWTSTKDGEDRYSTEVVMGPSHQISFLSPKKKDAPASETREGGKPNRADSDRTGYSAAAVGLDDEIPF